MTIKDLAKYCNVSVTTASYALNGSKEISEKTRKRILDAAIELNYHPSAYARGLKTKKTFNIGVFIPGFEGPVHHTVLSGIDSKLRNFDIKYKLLVTIADETMALIKEKLIDIAIIMDSTVSNKEIKSLSKIVPIITFDKEFLNVENYDIYPTQMTNSEGIYKLCSHLINKGCKKIGYLLGSSSSTHNRLRFEGYKKALVDHDLEINNEIIYDANSFTEDAGYMTILNAFKNKPLNIDSLMCGNDELALGALKAFNELNIKVPEDVKLTGFDNIDKAAFITPTLSTVAIDWYKYGQEMAQFAFNILNIENLKERDLMVKTSIIERDSTK